MSAISLPTMTRQLYSNWLSAYFTFCDPIHLNDLCDLSDNSSILPALLSSWGVVFTRTLGWNGLALALLSLQQFQTVPVGLPWQYTYKLSVMPCKRYSVCDTLRINYYSMTSYPYSCRHSELQRKWVGHIHFCLTPDQDRFDNLSTLHI